MLWVCTCQIRSRGPYTTNVCLVLAALCKYPPPHHQAYVSHVDHTPRASVSSWLRVRVSKKTYVTSMLPLLAPSSTPYAPPPTHKPPHAFSTRTRILCLYVPHVRGRGIIHPHIHPTGLRGRAGQRTNGRSEGCGGVRGVGGDGRKGNSEGRWRGRKGSRVQ